MTPKKTFQVNIVTFQADLKKSIPLYKLLCQIKASVRFVTFDRLDVRHIMPDNLDSVCLYGDEDDNNYLNL